MTSNVIIESSVITPDIILLLVTSDYKDNNDSIPFLLRPWVLLAPLVSTGVALEFRQKKWQTECTKDMATLEGQQITLFG